MSPTNSDPTLGGLSVLRGHDRTGSMILRIVREGLTSGALLLWGPEGVGKRTAGLAISRALLCSGPPEDAPCGDCPSCRTSLERHPDFRFLDRGEAASIGIEPVRELLRGTLEAPLLSPLRAVVIDDAHLLTTEGANSLLKTLEEPAPGLLFFLVTSAPDRLLPTLRSRLLSVRFRPLPESDLSLLARELFPEHSPEELASVLPISGGSVSRLALLLDPADRDVRERTKGFLGAFGSVPAIDMAAVTEGFSSLSDRESFDRFLDELERLLLSAERSLSGEKPLPSWEESALPIRYAEGADDFRRAQLHDKIGEMRRMAIHNINRGLALEQFFWLLEHSFFPGRR